MEESRIKEVAAAAQESFWATVASLFPEINAGDFPPDATYSFDAACESAVRTWVRGNTAVEAESLSPREIVEGWILRKFGAGDIRKTKELLATKRPDVFYAYYIDTVRGGERQQHNAGYIFLVTMNAGVQLIGWETGDANYRVYIHGQEV